MGSLPVHVVERLALTPSGCLIWTGRLTKDGYGQTKLAGRRRPVHVVVFEAVHGPVPAALDVGHVCHDLDTTCPGGPCEHRACAHPDHIAAQTRSENARGGRHAARQRAKWATALTCPAGHFWADGNDYVRPDNGRRGCRTCRREARRRYEARDAA